MYLQIPFETKTNPPIAFCVLSRFKNLHLRFIIPYFVFSVFCFFVVSGQQFLFSVFYTSEPSSAILNEYCGRDHGWGRGGKIVADHLHNTYHTPPSYNSHNTYKPYNTSHNTYHTPPPQIKLCPVFGQYLRLLWSFYILPNLAYFIFCLPTFKNLVHLEGICLTCFSPLGQSA